MNTSRIYIGYKLNYEECLIEEHDKYYLDLITKQLYHKEEFYNNLRIPYSTLDESSKNRILHQIKRIYQKDRQKLMNIKNLYIGDIGVVNKIISRNSTGRSLLDLAVETQYSYRTIEKDALLEKTSSYQYQNITNGIIIEDMEFTLKVGDYCLGKDGLKPFVEMLSSDEISSEKPKKWVLEKYNKEYKKGVRNEKSI